MNCCENILDIGCFYSCDIIQIGVLAPMTGTYTLELQPDGIKVVSTTNTASSPMVFAAGYLNEDGVSVFKIIKPDGTYYSSGIYDCFKVTIRPSTTPELDNTNIIPVECDHATAVLKNTALTTISTTTIASGVTANITAPDATSVLKNTVGTVIDTEAIPSGVSEDIIIPNVAWTDTDGSAESTPYGQAITCTPAAGLDVDFSADDTTPETNQTVTFTDATIGATTWLWDFGDGELSTLQNPTHAYKYAGTYSVILHADNGSVGGFVSKTNYITVTLQSIYATNLQMHNKAATGASPSNMTLVSGAVSQWNDDVGGYHRTQAIASSRPTYTQAGYTAPDGTVYGTVQFDGTDDNLRNNSAGLTRAAGSYEVILMRVGGYNNTNNKVFIEAGNASLYELLFWNFGGASQLASALMMYQSAAVSLQSVGISPEDWVLVKIHWNGAGSSIQIDNITRFNIPNNIGTGTAQGSIQGSAQSGSAFAKADFLEHAIYSAKPSDADIIAYIDNYFNSKFGLWE